jgi:hypothetical protein
MNPHTTNERLNLQSQQANNSMWLEMHSFTEYALHDAYIPIPSGVDQ